MRKEEEQKRAEGTDNRPSPAASCPTEEEERLSEVTGGRRGWRDQIADASRGRKG